MAPNQFDLEEPEQSLAKGCVPKASGVSGGLDLGAKQFKALANFLNERVAHSLNDWIVAAGLDRIVLEETNAALAVGDEIYSAGGGYQNHFLWYTRRAI